MNKAKFNGIAQIMDAKDSQLLKFLAVQKFEEIYKSTGDYNIALDVLESSMALDEGTERWRLIIKV